MGLWNCIKYLIVMGILAFLLGRILPKSWCNSQVFPYRSFPFENNGKIYDKIKIKTWQNKLPDMSRILPFLMPPKSLSRKPDPAVLQRMLQETCVAEFIHVLLMLGSLYCLTLWPGLGGAVLIVLYNLLGNIPFILIQRYNRPRLQRLADRLGPALPQRDKGDPQHESPNIELQHR